MVTGNAAEFERFFSTVEMVTVRHYFGNHRVSQTGTSESDICHKCNRKMPGEARAVVSAVGAGFPWQSWLRSVTNRRADSILKLEQTFESLQCVVRSRVDAE